MASARIQSNGAPNIYLRPKSRERPVPAKKALLQDGWIKHGSLLKSKG